MKRAVLLFGLCGGVVVPAAFTLAGWIAGRLAPDAADALALLHGARLPLWPMSKLFDDATAGKHWLYLPLAAVLSNALLYAGVGAVSAWGRANRAVFVVGAVVVVGLLFVAMRGFGSDVRGFLAAAAVALAGLIAHHRGAR